MVVSKDTGVERRTYPKKKRLMYQEMTKFPKEYKAIALSDLHKVRGSQLMQLRKKFRSDMKIRVVKNEVVKRAFESVDGVQQLTEFTKRMEGQCLLLFTDINPFRLNLIFDQSKIFLPAKGGDIAPREITVQAGNTGITPGPVLSEFKEANVPTKIDQGSIWVSKDTRVVKAGEEISQKLASLLSKLDIKPIEAGISVSWALAGGLLLSKDDLRIDLGEYSGGLANAMFEARNVAMACVYVTSETVGTLLTQARHDAMSLSITAGYITGDTIQSILSSTFVESMGLAKILKAKGLYQPN